jgi:sec-independent protein translocase protein TatB
MIPATSPPPDEPAEAPDQAAATPPPDTPETHAVPPKDGPLP